MKKLFAIFMCVVTVLATASCGKSDEKAAEKVERISPDTIITQEVASQIAGMPMNVSEDGVTNEGKSLCVTYIPDTLGLTDPITVTIEQFSDSLSAAQVWSDYETDRIRRSDAVLMEGIGTDCYIAYPYINVYDRGCYIKISAGSGGGEEQKNMLINLATHAVTVVQQVISAEAVNAAANDVIK